MCCKGAPGRNLSTHAITVGPWHPMLCVMALGITGPGRALSPHALACPVGRCGDPLSESLP